MLWMSPVSHNLLWIKTERSSRRKFEPAAAVLTKLSQECICGLCWCSWTRVSSWDVNSVKYLLHCYTCSAWFHSQIREDHLQDKWCSRAGQHWSAAAASLGVYGGEWLECSRALIKNMHTAFPAPFFFCVLPGLFTLGGVAAPSITSCLEWHETRDYEMIDSSDTWLMMVSFSAGRSVLRDQF